MQRDIKNRVPIFEHGKDEWFVLQYHRIVHPLDAGQDVDCALRFTGFATREELQYFIGFCNLPGTRDTPTGRRISVRHHAVFHVKPLPAEQQVAMQMLRAVEQQGKESAALLYPAKESEAATRCKKRFPDNGNFAGFSRLDTQNVDDILMDEADKIKADITRMLADIEERTPSGKLKRSAKERERLHGSVVHLREAMNALHFAANRYKQHRESK